MYPKLRVLMSQRMDIHAESAARSMERLLAAFDRLDDTLASRRFLVGDRFSRADLTACALLAPLCAPGRSEDELAAAFPAEVLAFREAQKTRPYFGWVDRIYRGYRHRGPEVASAAQGTQ
jgi:glutathione S-transferase